MLSQYLRLFTQTGIYPDGGADLIANPPDPLIDISLANQNGAGFLVNFDYLYIAQHYPFVNLFMLMETINAALNVVPVIAVSIPYNAIGPVDEIQSITFSTDPTSGTFTLTYGAATTTELSFDASGAEVEAALRLLAGLATVDVVANATGYLISFTGIASPTALSITPTLLKTSVSSQLLFEYWDGSEWRACVDVIDATGGLYSEGMIQFSLRNGYSWQEVSETDDDSTNCPVTLKGLYINNCYWLRMSFSDSGANVNPNPLTKIKRLCYAFSNTSHVNSEDISGPTYYESFEEFEPNKSNWTKEVIKASEDMVQDLKRVGFIKSAGQIIEIDELYMACTYKTLMHIYFNLGKAFEVRRAIMSNKYEKALTSQALTFDKDKDGKIDKSEMQATSTRMTR